MPTVCPGPMTMRFPIGGWDEESLARRLAHLIKGEQFTHMPVPPQDPARRGSWQLDVGNDWRLHYEGEAGGKHVQAVLSFRYGWPEDHWEALHMVVIKLIGLPGHA